jgi:transcriptional regulator NrdR family protein
MTAAKTEEQEIGLRCPNCGCGHFYTDKTVDVGGNRRRRYKYCRNCGSRIRTLEIIESDTQIPKK